MADGNGMPDSSSGYETGGIAFVGAIALGAGIGLWKDEFIAGLLIGIGAGFILMALLRQLSK